MPLKRAGDSWYKLFSSLGNCHIHTFLATNKIKMTQEGAKLAQYVTDCKIIKSKMCHTELTYELTTFVLHKLGFFPS